MSSSSSSLRGQENRDDRRRRSTYEVTTPTSPRHRERYLSVGSGSFRAISSGPIEIASRSSSSRRERSRDDSRRGSNRDVASSTSYREERYLSVPSGPVIGSRSPSSQRDVSRDSSRRGSTFELVSRTRTRSRSPIAKFDKPSPKFKYSPLDPRVRRAIRLIRIKDDLEGDRISCDIEHTSTSSTYSAVSYTWGSPQDTQESILINGCSYTVRRNLHEFLCHARRYYAGKPLWIDALCINQDDIPEKNRQVKMMSRIYSETREVLVWLGPRVDYVGLAMRRMQEYEDMGDTEMALSSSRDSDFWKGFKAINSAPYWGRVWVIQEFIQPLNGRIIQGDRSISFETFQNTIRRFDNAFYRNALKYWVFGQRRNEHFSDYISNIHPLWQRRIERAKRSSTASQEVDAEWALLSGSRFCRDIRDRVYGIMPLATHGTTLKVDYHLNAFEVLLEAIWLEHDSDMDRTEVLKNLANILMLTPASICMYAQKRTSRSDRHLRKMPRDGGAETLHLQAAASASRQEEWQLVSSEGRELTWRNFAKEQRLKMPKNMLKFPDRRQCPWNMFVYTSSGSNNVGLKLAVDSRNVPDDRRRPVEDRELRRSEIMTEEEFMSLNRKPSLALGVYRTTCAPFPLVIYYALVEGLEDVGKRGNNTAFFGEALEGLDDFDLDLDF